MKILAQIPKPRITPPNQRQLLRPKPTFDLLLPRNRVPHVSKRLKPHQSIHIIFLRKPSEQFLLVLEHPPLQVVRDADIEHTRRRAQYISMVNSHGRRIVPRPATAVIRISPKPSSESPQSCHPERSEGSRLDRAASKIDVT